MSNKKCLEEEDNASNMSEFGDQMSRMGFPKSWCKIAFRKTKTNSSSFDLENATRWLLKNEMILRKNHPVSIMDRQFKLSDDISEIAKTIRTESDDASSKLLNVSVPQILQNLKIVSRLHQTCLRHHWQLVSNHKKFIQTSRLNLIPKHRWMFYSKRLKHQKKL